jgi:hypothetical protein
MIVTADNLSDTLKRLAQLGQPRLAYMTIGIAGWHANIELPAPPGCKAKVASDFTHLTPEGAVQQMVDRLEALRGTSVAEQATNPRLKLISSK